MKSNDAASKFSNTENPEKEISKLLSALLNQNTEQTDNFKNKVFSVGGFVRDQILNIESNDLDLVVELPDGAQKFALFLNSQFKNETTEPFQKGFGYPIWYLKFKSDVVFQNQIYKTESGSLDLADTQKECFPDPTTRQRITTFGTLAEDIQRRDFTINMLAENLTTHEIMDLSGAGLSDLQSGVIQTHPLASPDQVFSDDPLRMIRALRFSTKYHFQIDPAVKSSILKNKERVKILSSERIWDELKKIILNGNFFAVLTLFKELQLDQILFQNLDTFDFKASDFLICKNDIALNLTLFLKQQTPQKAHDFLKFLKVEQSVRQMVLETLKALDELEQNSTTWNPPDYRQFFRMYTNQTPNILLIHPELQSKYDHAVRIPLQMTSILNGHDVMRLFNAKGSLIQKILTRALQIEDELILQYQKSPTDPQLQQDVLKKLKIEFPNA